MTRAERRANRERLATRWLRRIKAKWGKFRYQSNAHHQDEIELRLKAVKRVDTHHNIRNHSRKNCSYCNPVYRRLAEERELDRDFSFELIQLDVSLHDLLRPSYE
jgi:hypothetical protein